MRVNFKLRSSEFSGKANGLSFGREQGASGYNGNSRRQAPSTERRTE
jgi:hypothetical protein